MTSQQCVSAHAGDIQSLEEFLKNMEQGAQTLKWDALLVFDKAATNALLTQEYIDRIKIPDVFFPILPDGAIDSGNGIEHVLLGLVLDKPRLSFENANITSSQGKLQMRLVGGKHLEVIETFLDGKPHRSITALTLYNAATSGLLDMTIDLKAATGSVDDGGKVLLDLKDGLNHEFSGGATGPEKVRLGLYFDTVLKEWSESDERITQFPLSEIVVDKNSPINPGVFGIRTHAAPGATVRGAKDFGEGAVVVFIAMAGSSPGNYPHDDDALLYMLPAAEIPYTSNLVLSHKFMAVHVIKRGLDQYEWIKGKFDVVALAAERYKLVANDFADIYIDYTYADRGNGGTLQPWSWRLSVNGISPRLFSQADELVFKDRSLKARWHSESEAGILVYWIQTGGAPGGTKQLKITTKASVDASYKFLIDTAGDKPLLKFVLDDFNVDPQVEIEDGFGAGPGASDARKNSLNIVAEVKAKVASEFEAKARELMDMTIEIDALRLNNLLFRGENVVDPRDVSLPADLTLLGNLAPKRSTMVITPSEPIVASGGTIDFSVSPAGGSVHWSVSRLPGDVGSIGKFEDPSVGRYTAPSDEILQTAGQRRVIVTATRGELVSSTLVSVVPSHVTVNPRVAVVNVGRSFALSAGTPDRAALKWNPPELGTVAPDTDPLNPDGYKYTAPAKLPTRGSSEPNHYRVLRLDEVTVQPAAGGGSAKIDMLVVGAKNPNYWMEPQPRNDGTVALPFYRLSIDMEKVKVPEPIEWTVLRGSGSVDPATQVYTPGPDEDGQYVIVSAYHVNEFSADTHDYVILPVPFVPVSQYTDILNKTVQEV